MVPPKLFLLGLRAVATNSLNRTSRTEVSKTRRQRGSLFTLTCRIAVLLETICLVLEELTTQLRPTALLKPQCGEPSTPIFRGRPLFSTQSCTKAVEDCLRLHWACNSSIFFSATPIYYAQTFSIGTIQSIRLRLSNTRVDIGNQEIPRFELSIVRTGIRGLESQVAWVVLRGAGMEARLGDDSPLSRGCIACET